MIMKKLILLIPAFLMLLSCSNNPTPSNPESGISAKVYDCDVTPDDMASAVKMISRSNEYPGIDNKVYFECIGENKLRIRCQETINCAGELDAQTYKKDSHITLYHSDLEGELQADCICSHWAEHILTYLPYGKYTVSCTFHYVSPTIYSLPVEKWTYELKFTATTNISVPISEISVKN